MDIYNDHSVLRGSQTQSLSLSLMINLIMAASSTLHQTPWTSSHMTCLITAQPIRLLLMKALS